MILLLSPSKGEVNQLYKEEEENDISTLESKNRSK